MGGLTFLSPYAATVGLLALVPAAAIVARERRAARTRHALGLEPPRRRAHLATVGAWVVVFGLLGAAAAQPVVRVGSSVETRTDAQAFFVLDISRSMLAAPRPGAPTRLERAIHASMDVRRALPGLPVGAASITNRTLPHLFPTTDGQEFDRVVSEAMGVNRPPGSADAVFRTSTDFASLGALATDNFFAPDSVKRLVVLFTDGESPFAPHLLVRKLAQGGVNLVVVRFWRANERIWRRGGSPEPGYRPAASALAAGEEAAALTTGGRVYGEDELPAIVAAIDRYAGAGPTVSVPALGHTVSLAPHAVLAACVPLALLLLTGLIPLRLGGGAVRWRQRPQANIAYSMLARWRRSSTPARRPSRRARASLRRS